MVTELRALVLRSGRIFEQESLDRMKPEITGWGHNRIVTFGDDMESGFDSIVPNRIIEGNSGLYPSSLATRRGDVSSYPIRFYDLDPTEAERLMTSPARVELIGSPRANSHGRPRKSLGT